MSFRCFHASKASWFLAKDRRQHGAGDASTPKDHVLYRKVRNSMSFYGKNGEIVWNSLKFYMSKANIWGNTVLWFIVSLIGKRLNPWIIGYPIFRLGQDIRSHPAHGSAHLAPMIPPKRISNWHYLALCLLLAHAWTAWLQRTTSQKEMYHVGTKPFWLSSKRNLECNLFCWLRLTSCIAGWARIELDVHPNWGVKMICSTTWMG